MVEASYAGKTGSIKIDKQQEKTLIYLVAAVVLFIIAYVLYKGISAAEVVTKPISEVFETGTGAITGTLKTVTGIGATIVSSGVAVKEVAEAVYKAPQQMYNESTKAVEQSIGAPVGSYDRYLDSMGLLSLPLKIASTLMPDSVEAVAAQAGVAVRGWFDRIF